ncbi:hypothetical protein MLD52_06760 [Puniceicoccaceae bacterium K14]|nr:hypothetical protein [Puniceicoccaceae bacterium K14]
MKLNPSCNSILVTLLLSTQVLSGCANHLYFGTNTTIGLDVSGTAQVPTKIALAVEREEVAIVPNKSNGEAHSVFGAMDSNLTWFDGQVIKQVFATGQAAINAASGTGKQNGTSKQNETGNNGHLYFGTKSVLGIDINSGAGSSEPASFTLGFNRKEATVIPLNKTSCKEANSVYADISIVNHSQATNAADLGIANSDIPDDTGKGVRLSTRFATGKAAIALSTRPLIQQTLNEAVTGATNLERTKAQADQETEIREKIQSMNSSEFSTFAIWFKSNVQGTTFTQSNFKLVVLPHLTTAEVNSVHSHLYQ